MESELRDTEQAAATGLSHRLFSFAVTWLPVTAFASLIFWFSHQPSFGEAHFFLNKMESIFGEQAFFSRYYEVIVALDSVSSGIGHFAEYALLAGLTVWAISRQWPYYRHLYQMAFVAVALFALSDEFHQYFIPGRYCDWRDVATDWAGAAIAIVVIAAVHTSTKRRARK